VLVVLGGSVTLLVAVLIGLVVTDSSHPSTVAASTAPPTSGPDASSAPSTTPTTLELLPVISTVPTPPATAVASLVPSTAPTTTSTTAPPPVNGSGAVLTPPPAADIRLESSGNGSASGCASLADPGWGGVECGTAQASGAALTWLIESRPPAAGAMGTRAYVFRMGAGGYQQVVLQALDDNGQRFTSVKARVESVESGAADIVFGFRNQGSAEVLSVDLVRGAGVVAVHQDLYRGVARASAGQLDTWSAVLAAGDSNCCPASYQHDTIRFVNGVWELAGAETVSPSAVPPSQL
jgi:hypothetical protein